jgi:hypothetical protein
VGNRLGANSICTRLRYATLDDEAGGWLGWADEFNENGVVEKLKGGLQGGSVAQGYGR